MVVERYWFVCVLCVDTRHELCVHSPRRHRYALTRSPQRTSLHFGTKYTEAICYIYTLFRCIICIQTHSHTATHSQDVTRYVGRLILLYVERIYCARHSYRTIFVSMLHWDIYIEYIYIYIYMLTRIYEWKRGIVSGILPLFGPRLGGALCQCESAIALCCRSTFVGCFSALKNWITPK